MRLEIPAPEPPHIEDVSSCQEGSWCQVVIASCVNPWGDEDYDAQSIKITGRMYVIARAIQDKVDEAKGMTLISVDRKSGELQFSFRATQKWQL